MIQLNDIFHTVQGEGFYVGRRALFVRMPYCDLACPWCDTDFNHHKEWSIPDIVDFAVREGTRFAVITGGEPTMHKHTPRVIEVLKSLGYTLAIETNGHFPVPPGIDWVCCSPKRFPPKFQPNAPYFVHPEVQKVVNEYKYVVDDEFDFQILGRHYRDNELLGGLHPQQWRDPQWCHHWLSPEHTNWKKNVGRILQYIEHHPNWRLNLQTHKLIGVQ